MRQAVIQKAEERQRWQQPNLTGIPTQMKMDFEQRSGLSFDDVRVHYNSDKPARIGALAYTQIPEVHMGPGQERHLRHELGHVVQQKQGIVRPTTWINGLPVNNSPHLERLADTMQDMKTSVHGTKLPQVPAVQCAGQVAVSLIPLKEVDSMYTLDDLIVDSVKVHGRFQTSLKNESGNPVQGDHLVADILIKKYQLHMFRNLAAKAALEKYQEMGRIFLYHDRSTTVTRDGSVMDSSSADTPTQTQVNEGEGDSTKEAAASVSAYLSQFSEFQMRMGEFLGKCKHIQAKKSQTIHTWRKDFNALVWLFNSAYSLSPNAVVHKDQDARAAPGGHGEKSIPPVLRKIMRKSKFTTVQGARKAFWDAIKTGLDKQAIGRLPKTIPVLNFTDEELSNITVFAPDVDFEEIKKIPILYYILKDYWNVISTTDWTASKPVSPKASKRQRTDSDVPANPPSKKLRTKRKPTPPS